MMKKMNTNKAMPLLLALALMLLPLCVGADPVFIEPPGESGEATTIWAEDELFIQQRSEDGAEDLLCRYDAGQREFITVYQGPHLPDSSMVMVDGSLYSAGYMDTALHLLMGTEGKDAPEKIELFPDQFKRENGNNLQFFLLGASDGPVLTFMAASDRKGQDIFHLCCLDTGSGAFKSKEIFELKSFTSLSDGRVVYFSLDKGSNRTMDMAATMLDWDTMREKALATLPKAWSFAWDEQNSAILYTEEDRLMRLIPGGEAEQLMDLSDIKNSMPAVWFDQRGFLMDGHQYLVRVYMSDYQGYSAQPFMLVDLNDLKGK